MFITIPNVLSKNDFDWTCWYNWSMGFYLTIGNLSVCSSQVNFISCVNLRVLWQGKLTDDDSSVDLHEIIHWTTLINLQAMLKKENLRKNFLRVKQIADQNLGRCGLCILYTYISYCLHVRNHIALIVVHTCYTVCTCMEMLLRNLYSYSIFKDNDIWMHCDWKKFLFVKIKAWNECTVWQKIHFQYL